MIAARLFIAKLILSTSGALAADSTDFEPREHRDADGNAIVYRLFKPKNYDPAQRYPLVLFLHGAGERGTNNTTQVRDARYFARDEVQKDNPCFVLAPQCPTNRPAFQLFGEKKEFDQTYNDYAATGGQWKSYLLRLSKLPAGAKTHLLIVNSSLPRPGRPAKAGDPNPPPPAPAVSEFRLLVVDEAPNPPRPGSARPRVDFRKLVEGKIGTGNVKVSEDGTTLTVTGDARLKFPLEYTVTKDSVMQFEFRSTSPGTVHAIGLDTDEQFDYRWVQRDWGGTTHAMPKEPSIPMRLTLDVIEKLKKEFSLDEKRFYVTGLSMGGYGTWDLVARHPRMFAAAVPVCGGADETTALLIRDVPIWCFHGGADTVVKTQRSRNMIEALKKAGGSPKYTEYPGVGHNAWDRAYSDMDMIKWMFSQKRE